MTARPEPIMAADTGHVFSVPKDTTLSERDKTEPDLSSAAGAREPSSGESPAPLTMSRSESVDLGAVETPGSTHSGDPAPLATDKSGGTAPTFPDHLDRMCAVEHSSSDLEVV